MENTFGPDPTPEEASAHLADASASRSRLAESLRLPSFFFSSLGVVIAVQTATGALGISSQDAAGLLVLAAGMIVLVLVSGIQLARFRRLNGVWLGGLAGRVVLGTAPAAWLSYGLAFAASVWAAFAGQWWLVAVCSLAGGAAYAWSGRRWWRIYQGDPAAHARGESALFLTLLAAASVAGAVVLVTQR